LPKRQHLLPMHILRFLPRTDCKLCGCVSCYAFAIALASREKTVDDCPELQTPAYRAAYKRLSEDFGRRLVFEKVTGHLIDVEKCIGCGDCVVYCTRRVTPTAADKQPPPIRKRSDIWMRKALGHTATKSTAVVLGIVDGVVQVVNADMDACKECRACEDKCPTGAIELHR